MPLETLFVERLRERIKVRHQRTFGVMQQDPQYVDNLVHLDSPPRNDGWGGEMLCRAEWRQHHVQLGNVAELGIVRVSA